MCLCKFRVHDKWEQTFFFILKQFIFEICTLLCWPNLTWQCFQNKTELIHSFKYYFATFVGSIKDCKGTDYLVNAFKLNSCQPLML